MTKKNSLTIVLIAVLIGSTISPTAVFPVLSQERKREETLVIHGGHGKNLAPDVWNPFVPAWYDHWFKSFPMNEMLWHYADTTGEYIWWLATGFEYDSDYKGFTIHLRDNIEWSDGTPFTSEDLKWNMELWASLDGTGAIGINPFWNEGIESVTAPDATTLYIELVDATPRFHEGYFGSLVWLPRQIWEGEDPLTFEYSNPIGTGAYRLVSASEEEILFERRDDYWGKDVHGLPEPKYILEQWSENIEVALFDLERNSIDCFSASISGAALRQITANNPYVWGWSKNQPYGRPSGMAFTLAFNPFRYPLNYTEVRRAISLVIDREKASRLAFSDFSWYEVIGAVPPGPVGWNNSLYWERWTFPDLVEQYSSSYQNLTEATELLESIGFYQEDENWYTSDGTRMSLTITYGTSWMGTIGEAAPGIIADLAAFGITVIADPYNSFGTWFDAIKRMDYDMQLYGLGGRPNDIYYSLERYQSKHFTPPGEECAWPYYERYPPEHPEAEYDAIIQQLEAMNPDSPGYDDLVYDALEILYKEWWLTSVMWGTSLILWNHYYWVGQPDASDPYIDSAYWVYPTTVILHRLESNPDKPWLGPGPAITYQIVWFLKAVEQFTGADGVTYGPYVTKMSALVPDADATRLISEGSASVTPPPAELPEGLGETVNATYVATSRLETSMQSLENSIGVLTTQLSSMSTLLYAAIGLQVIVLLVVLVLVMRKQSS
jgi:peptide/nickel transport system substrate-binding protein